MRDTVIGKSLGHYEIVGPLGSGGMGEVYRARDSKLDREVAIKVLPEDLANDPERLARFEREAKLLASLTHANIAAIYGFEDADGIRFIAMELVEGDTLAELISASGRLSIDEALEVARQIAEALEAAHENGIVHRDLKPANVKVTPEDKVKVLDFGLAKAYDVDGSSADISPDLTRSPTMLAATQTGVIMGTAAYMSPEQARGKRVDKRADIWAFGCVLYEMLAGRRVFGGETVSDTLASILKEDPDWSYLPTSLPVTMVRLLERCLTKDPQQRLRDIGDARFEIGEVLSGTAPPPVPANEDQTTPTSTTGVPWRLAVPGFIAVAAVTVLLTLATVSGNDPEGSGAGGATRFEIPVPDGYRLSEDKSVQVSPDGRTVAFAVRRGASSQIYVRRLDELEAKPVAGTEDGQLPFFSPDGAWIGFSILGGDMYRVPVEGGERSLLARGPWWTTAAAWGDDDRIIADESANHAGLVSVNTDTGDVTPITEPDLGKGERQHSWPELLADGTVLFAVSYGDRDILARYFPEEGTWSRLGPEGSGPINYLQSGHLVFNRAGANVVVPFDMSRRTVDGSPVPMLPDADPGILDISANGTAAYLHLEAGSGSSLVRIDRNGRVQQLVEKRAPYRWPRLSPDGERLVVGSGISGSVRRLWFVDLDTGLDSLLQDDGTDNSEPVWSRDGERVAYSSSRSPADIYWQHGRGGGESVLLSEEPIDQWPTSFSPDDTLLAFYGGASGSDQDIWVVPVDGSAPARVVVDDPGVQRGARFSPDGRWIAYASTETGRSRIYLQPYPEFDRKITVSGDGAIDPAWSHDGNELFFLEGNRVMYVAFDGDAGSAGAETVLFEADFETDPSGDQSYDVFPNGDFVMLQPDLEAPARLRVLTGLIGEVERLLRARQ